MEENTGDCFLACTCGSVLADAWMNGCWVDSSSHVTMSLSKGWRRHTYSYTHTHRRKTYSSSTSRLWLPKRDNTILESLCFWRALACSVCYSFVLLQRYHLCMLASLALSVGFSGWQILSSVVDCKSTDARSMDSACSGEILRDESLGCLQGG